LVICRRYVSSAGNHPPYRSPHPPCRASLIAPSPAAYSELLEHEAVRHPAGHEAADTRDSEPVLGTARSLSDPSVGGTATVVVVAATGDVVAGDVVAGDVVAGDVPPGAVVPVARVVVVVAPTAVVLVVFAVVVVVVVDVLRAMKVKASASVSV